MNEHDVTINNVYTTANRYGPMPGDKLIVPFHPPTPVKLWQTTPVALAIFERNEYGTRYWQRTELHSPHWNKW